MASKIYEVNPKMAGLIGKALGIERILSVNLSARHDSVTRIAVEFVPSDDQCRGILGAIEATEKPV